MPALSTPAVIRCAPGWKPSASRAPDQRSTLSIPRTFTFRNSYRKPARLHFAVAGTTVGAAALVALGAATATPGSPGATAVLGTALASHGGTSTLPMTPLALDQAGITGGHVSRHPAAGVPMAVSGRAILASGLAVPVRAVPVRAGKSASRSGHQAPAARRARPAHHAGHRHTGPCASSTLHWWICSAEHTLEEHGVSRGLLSTSAADIVVQHESGGNRGAYNGWDSNAAAGHPSKGIAQVIGATFHAYALPGHHNIWNPVDNMIAAFRYAISRYGSMNSIPGVVAVRQGGSYLGY